MVGEYAEDLVPDAVVQVVEAPGSAFEEVLAGRADVVLATVIDAAEHLERGSLLQPAPVEPQNAIFIGLLIPQGDSELRSFVDAWIRAQDCSGYLAELTAKYHLDF